jgi:hypothetical protein
MPFISYTQVIFSLFTEAELAANNIDFVSGTVIEYGGSATQTDDYIYNYSPSIFNPIGWGYILEGMPPPSITYNGNIYTPTGNKTVQYKMVGVKASDPNGIFEFETVSTSINIPTCNPIYYTSNFYFQIPCEQLSVFANYDGFSYTLNTPVKIESNGTVRFAEILMYPDTGYPSHWDWDEQTLQYAYGAIVYEYFYDDTTTTEATTTQATTTEATTTTTQATTTEATTTTQATTTEATTTTQATTTEATTTTQATTTQATTTEATTTQATTTEATTTQATTTEATTTQSTTTIPPTTINNNVYPSHGTYYFSYVNIDPVNIYSPDFQYSNIVQPVDPYTQLQYDATNAIMDQITQSYYSIDEPIWNWQDMVMNARNDIFTPTSESGNVYLKVAIPVRTYYNPYNDPSQYLVAPDDIMYIAELTYVIADYAHGPISNYQSQSSFYANGGAYNIPLQGSNRFFTKSIYTVPVVRTVIINPNVEIHTTFLYSVHFKIVITTKISLLNTIFNVNDFIYDLINGYVSSSVTTPSVYVNNLVNYNYISDDVLTMNNNIAYYLPEVLSNYVYPLGYTPPLDYSLGARGFDGQDTNRYYFDYKISRNGTLVNTYNSFDPFPVTYTITPQYFTYNSNIAFLHIIKTSLDALPNDYINVFQYASIVSYRSSDDTYKYDVQPIEEETTSVLFDYNTIETNGYVVQNTYLRMVLLPENFDSEITTTEGTTTITPTTTVATTTITTTTTITPTTTVATTTEATTTEATTTTIATTTTEETTSVPTTTEATTTVCFDEDSMILINNKYVNISNVNVGDEMETLNGKVKVKKIYRFDVNNDIEIVQINEYLKITKGHRIFINENETICENMIGVDNIIKIKKYTKYLYHIQVDSPCIRTYTKIGDHYCAVWGLYEEHNEKCEKYEINKL